MNEPGLETRHGVLVEVVEQVKGVNEMADFNIFPSFGSRHRNSMKTTDCGESCKAAR
jgi:hypothetical protein